LLIWRIFVKAIKLKNIYTGEIVLCNDINETVKADDKVFIKVFKEENLNRTFLVNLAAFKAINQ